jgi:NAD(P)-dependent dehydrogenase (short-subunit alcohol dehydrogenase family)
MTAVLTTGMAERTAVVTGASRGIGEQVARTLAATGVHVILCARDADEIQAVADDIESGGGAVTALRADVRDQFDVERLVERAAKVGGPITYLVPNAGVYHGSPGETPLSEESYAAFDDHMRTNARGVFATVREAMPHLADDARIVVPTGAVAREGMPGYGSYAVSKAAAEAIVRGFAVDLGVPIGAVDPGQVSTALSGDGGRDPAAVARMVRWALEDLPAEELNGTVLDWGDYREATR